MAKTRVTNTTKQVIHLTLPGHKGSIMLAPGVTEVDTADFQQTLKAQSRRGDGTMVNLVQAMREEGSLQWDGDGAKVADSKPLSSSQTQDALRIIKETFTREQLDAYAKEDTRPEIQKAIEEQRGFVQSQNKPATEGGESPEGTVVGGGDQPSAADVASARRNKGR